MRLLRRCDNGDFSLTQFSNEAIPHAILSHTWGADTEEVTFEDLTNGAGRDKPGYKKIWFCGEQTAQDGLEWFWIDTCCIDKTNTAELSRAINSMFRWYRNSSRCYAYLSDVSNPPFGTNDESDPQPWELNFWRSNWFTRGWTLQELLAPCSVEFFSREGKRLGDKRSLMQQIRDITNVPELALQGAPLSHFSVNERFSWIQHRHTKFGEDKAYSLLGIFDVYIVPIYGEGTATAFKRLTDEIAKLEKCIQDLRLTDPCDDKKRIEDTKGGLLEDSYYWILQNPDFQQWHESQQNQLLWIKGDPGKGKTVLLCGIINELNNSIAHQDLLAYFFCQATDVRINSATAVLRGLLYLLVRQRPSLVSHIRKKYDHAGKPLFEDANAWIALREIFENILQDSSLSRTYLIIDVLDECVVDLPRLLDFIAQQSSASPRIKWIVSSRNWPDIEAQLARAGHGVRLSLELNAESVSTAVGAFVQQKVLQLVQEKKYDSETRDLVQHHLLSNADGTFLWVALVCQDLKKIPRRKVLAKLRAFPPGLDSLYRRMLDQICNSDDADLCKQILALIATVYRPVMLQELASLIELLDAVDDLELQEIISLCGSFLTVRDRIVYFVHQSAKDFLLEKVLDNIFPPSREDFHHTIFSRSLQNMSRILQRDIYSLGALGYPAEQVKEPDPDPLAALRYSCIYWIDHLCEWNPRFSNNYRVALHDRGTVDSFVRQKYLYWLEALSLCKSMSEGLVSMAKLEALIEGGANTSNLVKLVQDARRFIMYHKRAIENSPLQAYASALLFSPARSQIRSLFKMEELSQIKIKPSIGDEWSACLQTLEGHSSFVSSVAFSHDSIRLASASDDRTVKIWDASSGACLSTLEGHSDPVTSVAISHDSTRLASASYDGTVKIWDASSGACLSTLEVSRVLENISFDATGSYLYTASGTISISATGLVPTPIATHPQTPEYVGLALSSDRTWITCDSKKLVWLPSEYRPSCSAAVLKRIGIGVGTGRVWVFDMSA
ncbi:uncharacterized protein BDZ99DRAFT_501246 [Mytilinidion resinicola]|uniref:NACHT domain-containing protein n=1 Tax=Mytilinidion resinicola TaxID=574789 RepID=A0A6A6YCH9_9PEZI|nr:uncharacterized protein BDZ99DRAFT_501246 [Mytilinidion resinicola]KAF2806410.1 hypothetical protein BDZ99DRAFT_501246 [Mytilinidion resinicola]